MLHIRFLYVLHDEIFSKVRKSEAVVK